jgi:hypothetical protein
MVAAFSLGGMKHAYLQKKIVQSRGVTFSDCPLKVINPTPYHPANIFLSRKGFVWEI